MIIGSHPIRMVGETRTDPRTTALRLLKQHGQQSPRERFGLDESALDREGDAIATALMDLYRMTSSSEVFDALVGLASDCLLQRIRGRCRYLGARLDPQEVLQDAFVNIYQYPGRFDGSRPGAFRAWASTIVDNTIRRHLRRARRGPEVFLQPVELLARTVDSLSHEPAVRAIQAEDCDRAVRALTIVLAGYLHVYHGLSERERFVLQMVEVEGMRYAELAGILEIRPEALKMVVFRARRRIFERISRQLGRSQLAAAG